MSDQNSGDLERELGLYEATAIGLGTMIGGGIFILPSIAAAEAGPASAVSFAIGGGISLLSALSHAELATEMQESEGGGYEYVHEAIGPLVGSVVGWGMWLGLLFAIAFYAIGFARYLTFFHEDLPIAAVAIALAVLLTGLNYYGAAEAGRLQELIVLVLLVLIAGFVGVGLPNVSVETLRPFNPNGWTAVVSTTGTVYVSLIGFSLITTAAAEVRRPARNIPLAVIVSVVVPTVLYVLVMVVSTGVLPVSELEGSRVPVARVAARYLGGLGALAMVVGAVLATVSSANASILSAGRVSYAMARDGILSSWFAAIHDRFETPYHAVLVTGVGVVALVAGRVGIETLAEVASFVYLVTYGLVHVAVVQFRRNADDYDPEFRIPDVLYPAVPVLGLLATLAVMVQMRPVVVGIGLVIAVGGVVWYLLVARRRIRRS